MATKPVDFSASLILPPLAHSPDGAALRLGVPQRTIYTLITNGELRSLKIGRRRLITDGDIQDLLTRKMEKAGAA